MTHRRLAVVTLVIAFVSSAIGARATETDAARIQRLLWHYGDTSGEWSGADGAYSVPLPDGRTAWLFSDTFLGDVDQDARTRSTSTPLVNNTILIQDGERLTTHAGVNALGTPSALVPTEDQNRATWYWMGDGTVEGDKLHVFVLRFTRPIQQLGDDIATFTLPSMEFEGVTRLPLGFSPAVGATVVGWGAAVLERPEATYIYGLEDLHAEKYLHLARAPNGLFAPWEYWTGASWSPNPLLSARLLDGLSNEFSVHQTEAGFVLVGQDHGINPQVIACRAPAPHGPWTACQTVFETPETGGTVFTYNAKAHPHLGDDGRLTISYNVNTTNYGEHFSNIDIYRPRFVDVGLPEGF